MELCSKGHPVVLNFSMYVTALPATFIIGRDGEIKERVDNVSQLSAALARNI